MKKTYTLSKLASYVKKRRVAASFTREALAKKAKVNYNTIIKIESGANKNPTIKTLVRLAKVFRCSVDDFFS